MIPLPGLRGDIQTIFFDAAGTLFRVRGSVGAIYASHAEKMGLAATSPESITRLDQAFKSAFHRREPLLFPGASAAELPRLERSWWREIVEESFSSLGLRVENRLFDRLFSFFAQADAWQLEPGCRRTIEALAETGFQLAVVSNFDSRLEPLLKALGLHRFFSSLTVSSRVGLAKPDPAVFRVALERAAAQAASSVHIGNHPIEDYRAARQAGLQAVLYDPKDAMPNIRPRITRLPQLVESS